MAIRSLNNSIATFRDRFKRTGTDASSPPQTQFQATGGDIANLLLPGNGYAYHTFGSTGSFITSGDPKNVDILLVGSGGGGGSRNGSIPGGGTDGGAGAGAGGLVLVSSYPITPGTYTITINGGGAGGPIQSPGSAGGDVTITYPGGPWTLTAKGGGFGGSGPLSNPGGPGGSGGGEGGGGGAPGGSGARGIANQPPQSQGIPAPFYAQYGNDGGYTTSGTAPYVGSGGGGAGGVGGTGNSNGDGLGGVGRQYPPFTGPLIGLPALNPLSGFFAGGGGGGAMGPSNDPGPGGSGGGGAGGSTSSDGQQGAAYSGGGGGGGGGAPSGTPGGRGCNG